MIKQLFKANLLGTLVLVAFMLLAVSGLNEVKAQQQAAVSLSTMQSITPSEFQDFRADLQQLVEETENSNLPETQIAIRLFFYKEVYKGVANGLAIEHAIERAVKPTLKYTEQFKSGSSVDVRAIAEETKQRLL